MNRASLYKLAKERLDKAGLEKDSDELLSTASDGSLVFLTRAVELDGFKEFDFSRALRFFYEEHGKRMAAEVLQKYRLGDDPFALCDEIHIGWYRQKLPENFEDQIIGNAA